MPINNGAVEGLNNKAKLIIHKGLQDSEELYPMRVKPLLLLGAFMTLTYSAGAQQGSRGGSGGAQAPGLFGGPGQQAGASDPSRPRPVYIRGKVILDDGTTPAQLVTIERVCDKQTFPETRTNSKGRFSLAIGDGNAASGTDASVAAVSPDGRDLGQYVGREKLQILMLGSSRHVDLTGCELRAALPGYRSDVITLGRRTAYDKPDIGVIVLHRLENVESTAVSITTLAAPKKAKKAYEKALKELLGTKPNPKRAAKDLEKAVSEYPEFAAAWALLGETRLAMGDDAGAREALQNAIGADAKYLKPYVPLVKLAMKSNHWQRVAQLSDDVLRLNPHHKEIRYYHAVAAFHRGNMEAAEKSALAITSGKGAQSFPLAHHLLGMIHSRQGDFLRAATDFRTFLKAQPDSPIAPDVRRQLSEWEVLGVIEAPAGETASASP